MTRLVKVWLCRMFVGATLLGPGYQTFMGWVVADADTRPSGRESQPAG